MSDDARRRFLGELVDALGPGWSACFGKVSPFGVLGVTLFFTGVDDHHVEVVPSSVTNNVVSWKSFPSGKPHYDIHAGGELLRTCVLEKAVALLDGWRRSHVAVERSMPVPMDVVIAPAARAHVVDATDDSRLTREGRSALAAALAAIDAEAIARGFPRDDDGSVTRNTRALLVKLASNGRLARGRDLHLVVSSPGTRKGGNVLCLAVEDAIRENASHDWTDAPWLWRRRARHPVVDPRAEAASELLHAGRFDDAFGMFDIALEPKTIKVLEGVPLNTHDARLAPAWRVALRRALWETAPWLLRKNPAGCLTLLPNQRHQRKAWLAWSGRSLDIVYTGSNARLPDVAWRRPVR